MLFVWSIGPLVVYEINDYVTILTYVNNLLTEISTWYICSLYSSDRSDCLLISFEWSDELLQLYIWHRSLRGVYSTETRTASAPCYLLTVWSSDVDIF